MQSQVRALRPLVRGSLVLERLTGKDVSSHDPRLPSMLQISTQGSVLSLIAGAP